MGFTDTPHWLDALNITAKWQLSYSWYVARRLDVRDAQHSHWALPQQTDPLRPSRSCSPGDSWGGTIQDYDSEVIWCWAVGARDVLHVALKVCAVGGDVDGEVDGEVFNSHELVERALIWGTSIIWCLQGSQCRESSAPIDVSTHRRSGYCSARRHRQLWRQVYYHRVFSTNMIQ